MGLVRSMIAYQILDTRQLTSYNEENSCHLLTHTDMHILCMSHSIKNFLFIVTKYQM